MNEWFDEKEKKLISLLEHLKETEVDFDFIQSFRATLAEEMNRKAAAPPVAEPALFRIGRPLRFAFSVVGTFAILLGIAGGAAWASQKSLPNDFLYPVKLATERTRLALAPSDRARVHLRVQFAETRLREAGAIGERQTFDPKIAVETLQRFEGELNLLHQEITQVQGGEHPAELLQTLLTIEQQLLSERTAVQDLAQKINQTPGAKNEGVTAAFNQAENAAELGLDRTQDRIFDLQRQTGLANGDESLRHARILRALDRLEIRLNDLVQVYEAQRTVRLESLRESNPTIAVEPGEIAPTPKEEEIAAELAAARKALEDLKTMAGEGNASYLVLIEGIPKLEDELAVIEAKLGE